MLLYFIVNAVNNYSIAPHTFMIRCVFATDINFLAYYVDCSLWNSDQSSRIRMWCISYVQRINLLLGSSLACQHSLMWMFHGAFCFHEFHRSQSAIAVSNYLNNIFVYYYYYCYLIMILLLLLLLLLLLFLYVVSLAV